MRSSRLNRVSLFTLIIANGLAIWQFSANGGNILEVLWVYWLQSVIIGIINIWRIFSAPLKVASSQKLSLFPGAANSGNTASPLIRFGAAGFFMLHYGMFHLVYAVFLAAFSTSGVTVNGISSAPTTTDKLFNFDIDVRWVIIGGLVFAIHHTLTFLIERHQLKLHPEDAPNIQEVMGRPYSRIIPMHLIIIFGPWIAFYFGSTYIFAVFMILKTIADIRLFYKGYGHPGTINPSLHPSEKYSG